MSDYDAVIFDQDGVLLDSGLNNFLWMDQARKNAAEKLGYNFTTQDSVKVVETTSRAEINEFLKEKGMSWEDLSKIESNVAQKKVEMIRNGYIRLVSDARILLESLDVPIGLATNASEYSTDFTLSFFGIESYFDSVRNVELKKERWFECKKPNATLVEGVKDDLEAENVLMVGDTSSDVGAAQGAGVDSVLVESYRERNGLSPDYRVKSVSEVRRIL